jgi:hypothetical protein
MSLPRRLLLPLLLCALFSACATRQAKVEPMPPLAVPDAPPRVIAPVQLPEPEEEISGPPAPDPAPARPPRRPPARPVQKNDTKEEPAKTDPVVVEAPAEDPQPAPTLRTPQTADDQAADRRVRETLQAAGRALAAVDYAALNPDAQAQYDTAKRFIQQAEEALKNKNYVFATYLADKADTLARSLQRR